jgi:hypothetical protein
MDFGEFPDNPFSLERDTPRHSRRRSVISLVKLLLLVALCLAVTVVVGSQSRRLVLHYLTRDLDSLSGAQKQARLKQIADLDLLGISPLALTLADNDVDVARTAFDLLRRTQSRWTVLDRDKRRVRQAALVDAIRSVAISLPDDRTGWGTSLLQPTIEATVDSRDQESRLLYQDAIRAMEMLSLSDRAGPSILNEERFAPVSNRPMIVRSKPLPVSAVQPVDQWTDWPPPQDRLVARADASTQPPSEAAMRRGSQAPRGELAQLVTEPATVYMSSSSSVALQPLQSGEPILLRDINEALEADQQDLDIRPVAHLVDSPMETFDDKSVIYWLASPDPEFRRKSKLELMSRGYSETQIAIATQIASGDSMTKRGLIESLVRSPDIDPRPWLLMMLDDRSREVRLRVISVLATMNDRAVTQQLRIHLVDERDPIVAARIRRVLDVR